MDLFNSPSGLCWTGYFIRPCLFGIDVRSMHTHTHTHALRTHWGGKIKQFWNSLTQIEHSFFIIQIPVVTNYGFIGICISCAIHWWFYSAFSVIFPFRFISLAHAFLRCIDTLRFQTLSAFSLKMALKWLLISHYIWGFQFVSQNPFDKIDSLYWTSLDWTLLIINEPLQIQICLTIDIELPMNFLRISCFDSVLNI